MTTVLKHFNGTTRTIECNPTLVKGRQVVVTVTDFDQTGRVIARNFHSETESTMTMKAFMQGFHR